ncbi:UNVERIFIED_CONTAM: hypothetical protein H355_014538 [Colinus virginianus]|nr:hypothetical protein H355_014538 [Colinus virginianus]
MSSLKMDHKMGLQEKISSKHPEGGWSVCCRVLQSEEEGELGITNLCSVSDINVATVSCKFGCSRAEDAYGVEAQNYLNEPGAPFASTIGSHNITLGWKPANISVVKYIIQWKFHQLPGDWRYTEVVSETSYTVKDLKAFTEYEFRVVWIITSQLQLHSPSSPSYRTHASGVPSTAPIIKDIQSSSPNTVEVSWSPPLFPNGLIVGYNLVLTSENHELFSIVAVNEAGAGPPAEANITTLESKGNSIWVKGAVNMSDVSDLTLFYTGWGNITSISVDWLYQKIYFVMNEKVHFCQLENCTAAEDITPLYVTSPRKIIADPYNGYIFCLQEDGVYRANLPLFPHTASTASLVVKSRTLRDFIINFSSKRLIFFNKTDQAFVSGFLDGSEFHTLRSHVPFDDMESFVYEDNIFTVTDGRAVFHEEISQVGSSSFNEYVVDCSLEYQEYFGFGNLLFYATSTQPFPLPTLPQLVTVLFGLDQAVISWSPPEHTTGTSLSAWQNWTYDVKVSSQSPSEKEWVISNITDTRFTVKELVNFTEYEMSVRAVSPAGEGQWSKPFRGMTFEEAEEEPYILAVGEEGLWKQRLDSYGPGEFLHPDIRNISDLDWYNDTLYWINSMGKVETWSLNKKEGTVENTYIPDIKNARMLAYDWLGQCLYWAGKANTIYRKSLLGGHMDVVSHVAYAVKDLVVDSVNGYLYWATTYTVESARLNGEEYLMLQEHLQFSGKQVVGLALDLTYGFLYWFVQDDLNLNLYRLSICKESCGNVIVTEFSAWSISEVSQTALQYYSGRLFWINKHKFITTQEVNQSVNIPFSEPAEFAAFTLVHTSLKPLPVPSAPANPRIYVLHNNIHEGEEKVLVEFRWDKPERDNGVLTQFRVYYQLLYQSGAADTLTEWNVSNVKPTVFLFSIRDVLPRLTVKFQVQAFTSVGPGPMSDVAQRNSSDFFPVPTLITFSANKLFLTDIDNNHTIWEVLANTNIKDICYTANDEKVYYILEDSLFLLNIQSTSESQFFVDVFLRNVTAITVDWIARHLFVALKTTRNETRIFFIDLELKSKSLQALNIQLDNQNSAISCLLSYPFLGRLYWIEELDYGSRMFYYDILNNTMYHILGYESVEEKMRNYCNCNVAEAELGRPMSIDVSDIKKPQLLFIRGRDEIWASDMDACHCWRITKIPGFQGTKIGSLTVDNQFIYWTVEMKESTEIYLADKESTRHSLQRKANHELKILAYSSAMQLYPDKKCLTPLLDAEKPTILDTTNTSFTLSLPSVTTQELCPSLSQPTPTYLVFFREMTNDHENLTYHFSTPQQKTLEIQEPIAVINNLKPFSSYAIQVAVKNYYSDQKQLTTGKETIATTLYGVPGAVDSVKAVVLSDTTINISWSEPLEPNGPLELIRYQISVNLLSSFPKTPLRKSEFPNGTLSWSASDLQSGTSILFKVLAFHPNENWFSESAPVIARTFETPPSPSNIIPRNTSFQLEWRAPLYINGTSFWFELHEWQTRSGWFSPASTTCTIGPVYTCNLTGTLPSANYLVRATVVYITGMKSTSSSTSFKTTDFCFAVHVVSVLYLPCLAKAGVPSKPGTPKRAEDSINSVQWEKAEDNGSNLTYNILESRKQTGNTNKVESLWVVVYNGSCDSICTWKAENLEGTFQFRAAAANMLGLGEYSDTSKDIVLSKGTVASPDIIAIVAVVGAVLLGLTIVILFGFVWHQRWKSRKPALTGQIVLVKEDKELAQLRGLAETVGLANACYAVSALPSQAEIESLPAFPRDKLNLHKLLGSGAFGEVYEGTALDILADGSGESKVAVKTLKRGATDQEKSEFLKEAHLMSKFDHPHILKLLGVCLLNEPQYLILELMEGGDLLSYLRGARKQKFQSPLLTLTDLLDICLDICKGCVYLEKMHFIHRAFGVLMWETLTLGQQPYPGLSNIEVLHHVRSGGRLESPNNCPDDM